MSFDVTHTATKLEDLCNQLGLTADARYTGEAPEDWPNARGWAVTLRYKRRRLTVPFYQGPAITKDPSAADVIYCLCSDARAGELTFEEFCSEFGYDVDSRKAERTWRACRETAPKLRRLLGSDFETFANGEH